MCGEVCGTAVRLAGGGGHELSLQESKIEGDGLASRVYVANLTSSYLSILGSAKIKIGGDLLASFRS